MHVKRRLCLSRSAPVAKQTSLQVSSPHRFSLLPATLRSPHAAFLHRRGPQVYCTPYASLCTYTMHLLPSSLHLRCTVTFVIRTVSSAPSVFSPPLLCTAGASQRCIRALHFLFYDATAVVHLRCKKEDVQPQVHRKKEDVQPEGFTPLHRSLHLLYTSGVLHPRLAEDGSETCGVHCIALVRSKKDGTTFFHFLCTFGAPCALCIVVKRAEVHVLNHHFTP